MGLLHLSLLGGDSNSETVFAFDVDLEKVVRQMGKLAAEVWWQETMGDASEPAPYCTI